MENKELDILYMRRAIELAKMAEELDLMLSGGSDFHAAMKPHIRIGSGVDGNLAVDYALLEKIKGACGRG